MKIAKNFKLLFIILIVVFFPVVTNACGNTEDSTNNDSQEAITNENILEPEIPAKALGRFDRIGTGLPDIDFEGYTFNIATWFVGVWTGDGGNDGSDIWVEEEIGEALNDSVYRRNRAIEEKYNININMTRMDIEKMNAAVKNTVLADDNEYDLVYQRLGNFTPLITAGYLTNLYNVPYLNFDKPWWDKRSVDQQSIAGKTFIAASDLIRTDKNSESCVLFNKQFAQDYEFENLYGVVKRGDWTIDYWMGINKGLARIQNEIDKLIKNISSFD